MLKRTKVIVIIAVLLSLMVPVIAFAKDFSDIPAGHWARRDIQAMADLGFVTGAPDGNFYPDNPVTRAEFAAMIVKSLKLPLNVGQQATFKDVNKKHWAFAVVETAGKAGFIKGDKGFFRPDDKISRQEMGVIVMKVSEKYGYAGDGSTGYLGKYKDSELVSQWAAPSLSDATKFGYMQEVSYSVYESTYDSYHYNRILAPLENATRAQAASAIYKVLLKVGLI